MLIYGLTKYLYQDDIIYLIENAKYELSTEEFEELTKVITEYISCYCKSTK